MSEKALENARRRREELADRINRAQQELDECRPLLARIDQFLADYESFTADVPLNGSASGSSVPGGTVRPVKSSARRNSSKEEVSRTARAVIELVGEPVPRDRLFPELVKSGLTIEGTDPEGVLNTMLWRTRDQFGVIHLRNVGYWLKERNWEPASYIPDLDDLVGVEDDAPPSEELDEDETAA